MLKVADLDYEIPEAAIARRAAEPRDSAKLLVVSRTDPARVEHRVVRDLPQFLHPHDLLVVNTTRVLPARLVGYRADTRGGVEGLFLGLAGPKNDERLWSVLLRGRRMRDGITINLTDESGADAGVRLALLARGPEEEGAVPWEVRVYGLNDAPTAAAVLDRVGRTPLPPYILGARKRHGDAVHDAADRSRYQTVFAGDGSTAGSVAAPTAGLHFTPALLDALRTRGVARSDVTLHVGTGTFKPVEAETVEQHPMHAEWCGIPAPTGAAIRTCRGAGGRVIAVGTTTARTLESFTQDELAAGG
ncbi:MAG: S-adenosylmethionine:tRNA ribosyltransferase-isomerase, partial [Phycisphaerales bacterium]|nr:S-adenosylmethionine:tRNA ribosyltransferase-isomerase [Phycisphaerales bacterium]